MPSTKFQSAGQSAHLGQRRSAAYSEESCIWEKLASAPQFVPTDRVSCCRPGIQSTSGHLKAKQIRRRAARGSRPKLHPALQSRAVPRRRSAAQPEMRSRACEPTIRTESREQNTKARISNS